QLPLERSDLNTLACCNKNEQFIPELKDALLDFAGQIGQSERSFDFRYWFGGGDGMSYAHMLLIQKYMRNHVESDFQSFRLMRPVLQGWHTMWTDICRIHETHWGAPLNDNPASLGNSAKKIGRPAPPNLKVDYYPAADLLALVHDTRMLDCWRIYFKCDDLHAHFTELTALKRMPSFEELEAAGKYLYDTYTSTIAQKEAIYDARDGKSEWAKHVSLGSPWVPLPFDATSASAPKEKRKSKAATSQVPSTVPLPPPILPFFGDQVIADEAAFMRDASISREVSAAVAVGDVGRMWEGMKVMLINFAGSGHSRYFGYLLEMAADLDLNLELESSPALKNATLASMVCNPSGRPGGTQACDFFQERMNRELEPIIQRKDTDYGADHIRNMWSRNLKDIYDLKVEMRASAGLAKRSGRHKHPHSRPEVRTLLRHFKDVELHLFKV
ncbi:hypothetical protein B0H16DRAFT_1205987, partial [Mycena metata]